MIRVENNSGSNVQQNNVVQVNNNENNRINILARSVKGGLVTVPNGCKLVSQRKMFNSSNENSLVLKEPGWRFSFPGLYFNTVINVQPVSVECESVSYDSKDYSEIKLLPIYRMSIVNEEVFYNAFCGGNSGSVLTMDDLRIKMVHREIMQTIEQIVALSTFDALRKYRLRSEMKTLKVPVGDQMRVQRVITYLKDDMSDELYKMVCQNFTDIRNRFGIGIESLGFLSVDKPQVIVEQERKEMVNASENSMRIKNAETAKRESELRLNATENDAKGIHASSRARIEGPLSSFSEHSFTPEQASEFMYAQNSRTVNVRGGAMPILNINNSDLNDLNSDLGLEPLSDDTSVKRR